MLQIVPWLNAVLIIALFVIISNRITIAPGIQFNLPKAPIEEGVSDKAPKAVILNPTKNAPVILFFDDIRYRLDIQAESDCLATAISRSLSKDNWTSIILYADNDVRHKDIMKFVTIARRAGAKNITIATDTGK